jgi:hypothetical protein
LTLGIRNGGIGEQIRCAAINSAYAVCSARCLASSRLAEEVLWGGRNNGFTSASPKWILIDGVSGITILSLPALAYEVQEESLALGEHSFDLLIRVFASDKLPIMRKPLQRNKLEPPVGLEPTAC